MTKNIENIILDQTYHLYKFPNKMIECSESIDANL